MLESLPPARRHGVVCFVVCFVVDRRWPRAERPSCSHVRITYQHETAQHNVGSCGARRVVEQGRRETSCLACGQHGLKDLVEHQSAKWRSAEKNGGGGGNHSALEDLGSQRSTSDALGILCSFSHGLTLPSAWRPRPGYPEHALSHPGYSGASRFTSAKCANEQWTSP